MHYHNDGWTISPGEATWISDVGRRKRDGTRVYRKDGTAWGEPSYQLGDEIGLYFGGTLKVPVLVEVIGPPDFNPTKVQAESHGQEPDAGERWPWVTGVRGVLAKPLQDAPSLDDIGVPHEMVMRRPKFTISPTVHGRLSQALRR